MTEYDGRCAGVDGDDVEANIGDAMQGTCMAREPDLGEPSDLVSLAPIHRVFRCAACAAAARLDLNEGEDRSAPGYEIEFAAPYAHVTPEQAPARSCEVIGCRLLGGAPECLTCVHTTTVARSAGMRHGADRADEVTLPRKS